MRTKTLLLGMALAAGAVPVLGQVRVADLARPPPDAHHFVIESAGGKHGDSWTWMGPDGTRMARESMNLRGQIWELEYRGKGGTDGLPVAVNVRGFSPQGDATESFWIEGGSASWRSPIDGGSATARPNTFYVPLNAPVISTGWLLERLIAANDHTLTILPGGTAHAKKLTTITVHGEEPSETRPIALWTISGLSNSPIPVWANTDGSFFGLVGGVAFLPEVYAHQEAALESAQAQAMAGESAQLFRQLGQNPNTTVAFTGVRVFDSERQRFMADQTVLVEKGKIATVGLRSAVKVPGNALVIAGSGDTLLPGLWDCHLHVADDYTGVEELALGVTSIRDPGNDDRQTMDRRKRIAEGKLLFPHVYASSLIDGKSPYTAQQANVATSEKEAVDLVDRAKANRFTAVKFYGSFDRAWLPDAISEAHRLGLHVHGHIPVGMRPLEAIQDGYDEVTHINWIIMQAMPDSVIAASNGIARFEGPGRYGKDVDLNGSAITQIVSTMAGKHIYSDPTMVAFEALYVPDNGDLSPAYAPFSGTLPPVAERNFRQGGFAVPAGLTRDDYRASWAKMVELLKKMHEAGVPIVAGTDGTGLELVHELEIYQQAGFTTEQALAAATLLPAKLMDQDRHTGSITEGKMADLVLVEGDVSESLAALRQTRMVMLDGRLMDADQLRRAAGFSGRPRPTAAPPAAGQ